MRLVFANSAAVRAPERLVRKGGGFALQDFPVRYGILHHPGMGLVLVDTGYSPRVTAGQRSLSLRLYNAVLRPKLLGEGAPAAVLGAMGATLADVKAIILTHFHADHVAALDQFPQARIITSGRQYAEIRRRNAAQNLRHGIFPELLPADLGERLIDLEGMAWRDAPLGLGAGRDIFGDGRVLAIDLPGHAEGHIGLCFPERVVPFLYAVDVQWVEAALTPGVAPGLPASLVATDPRAAIESTARVDAFRKRGGEVLLCHDPMPSAYDWPEGEP